MMPNWLSLLRTARLLGISNVIRVAYYRLSLRLGFNPVQRLVEEQVAGPFFVSNCSGPTGLSPSSKWIDKTCYFGWAEFEITGKAPAWHFNPFKQNHINDVEQPWFKIPDFSAAGDIKVIWEPSRFDWVISNAQRAREGDGQSFERLNFWLDDWLQKNPVYRGPNWKCGQEASIRLMHLAVAAIILDQVKRPLPALSKLIEIHLRRIAPTLSYAVGQDNNHGTSEAAALFIGGSWLESLGLPEGKKWAALGRKTLEERVQALVASDGSFSQYSIVYQRVLIDTLVICERWRQILELPNFSASFYARAQSAVHWLYSFTAAENGHTPNLGANDGASLLPLGDHDFRDFRPSIQMATAIFSKARAFVVGANNDDSAHWLGIAIPEKKLLLRKSEIFPDGGFAIINRGNAWGYLRYPNFKFRPSQADLLHFDLWRSGDALLRDAGSYSYAAHAETYNYFSGTAGHNTVMFDNHDQMPRLSRFLFADWITADEKPTIIEDGNMLEISAGYHSRNGNCHRRTIRLSDTTARIVDEISGFAECAVLRWRLPEGSWEINDQTLSAPNFSLRFAASMPIERAEIVIGSESVYYLAKKDSDILEIEVGQSGTLTTFVEW